MTTLDWWIVGLYLCFVLWLGLFSSRRIEGLSDYFLAGRKIGVWAVVISIIATETSAATVIGGPDTSFRGNCAYLQTTIGAVLSRFFLAYFFIDVYYRHRVFTVYAYLADRFSFAVQAASALLFCVGRLFASGARLYIASLAVSVISGMDLNVSILIVGAVALIYGVVGGLRAVIVTDVLQGILFLAAGVYSFWLLVDAVGGISQMSTLVLGSGKLDMFDLNVDIFSLEFWANPYTFIGAVLGGFTLGLATHGTDQDMVQRMLACRTSREGRRSLVFAGLLELPVALLFVGLGLVLWVYYQSGIASLPPEGESVFPYFIRTAMPAGVRGLMLAAILAAAMSSLDSALTALSSVSVTDLYLPLKNGAERAREMLCLDGQQKTVSVLRTSRAFSLFWGILLVLTAVVLGAYHQGLLADSETVSSVTREAELLSLALGVMAILYGPLLGVFIVALFTKRGSTQSVLLGMLAGLVVVAAVRFGSWIELGWTWHVVVGCIVSSMVGSLGKTKG